MFLQPPNQSFDLAKAIVLCGKSYRLTGQELSFGRQKAILLHDERRKNERKTQKIPVTDMFAVRTHRMFFLDQQKPMSTFITAIIEIAHFHSKRQNPITQLSISRPQSAPPCHSLGSPFSVAFDLIKTHFFVFLHLLLYLCIG